MADNFSFTQGSGATGAADDIEGVLFPRVKVIIGANGTNDGDVSSANPLPVTGTITAVTSITNALPAGTNAIGKLAANTGVDIGDVDVTSSALPTGASTSAKQDTIIAAVDGLEATATSIDGKITACNTGAVVLAAGTAEIGKLAAGTALIGKVGIDQSTANANEVVVKSGTITADLGANNDVTVTSGAITETNSGAIKTAVETLDNAISGTEMQVDVITTSIDKSINGAGAPTIDSYASVPISASANTANQSLIAAQGASKQIWVYGINFTCGTGAGSVSFQDEDDTAISGVMPFAEKGGMVVAPSGNFAMPMWKVATNKALEVDTVTCDIKGSIQYAIVSV